MSDRFDCFVVFAEMRTGSNFLEANLNAFDGVTCHGEAFNPHFIGYPNRTEILGITQPMRDADPRRLIETIKMDRDALGGFRFFHDHDARVLDIVMADPRCAKIILTRNPLDSYVSWKIAQATGQWKLTNVAKRKDAKARFDGDEFAAHVEALQDFQVSLLNRLQVSGQTPFYVAYEDLQSVDVMNGLAAWLGVPARLEALDKNLKRQNPSPVIAKVENPDEMINALAGLDRFNLTRTPNFEPRRGASVPSYVAAARAPLLYLPIKGGPEQQVESWLASLDGVALDNLRRKMNQKDLRHWKRQNPGHRTFTVLRHPAARAHATFCDKILSTGPGSYAQVRRTLRRAHNLPIPADGPDGSYDRDQHRAAFMAFLEFLRANLSGQTAMRIDAHWCSQAQMIQGFGDFALPDFVLRENELPVELPNLASRLGLAAGTLPDTAQDTPFGLDEIYDEAVEFTGRRGVSARLHDVRFRTVARLTASDQAA